MANSVQQAGRAGELDTPLGQDVLVLTRFSGTEALSELFEYRVDALCTQEDVSFDDILGKHCSVGLSAVGNRDRWFDGILTEVEGLGDTIEGPMYRLVLRPWFWLLSRRTNSLIFHEQTAPDIIAAIFSAHGGLAEFESLLSKGYPELEYCVQYQESDMAFVSRLMERHGISFHFRHERGRHTLVMGDSLSSYAAVAGSKRPYYPPSGNYRRSEEHFSRWSPERRFTTGKVTLNDYDFKKPSADLEAEKTGDAGYEHGQLESYVYPGNYVSEGDGETYAQVRLDMERAADTRFYAVGDCATCYPGALVTLEKHPNAALNVEYLVLRCRHTYYAEAYRSGGAAESDEPYQGEYEFMPSSRNYAPPNVTARPRIPGPQTAKVVGEGEIDCDEHGRILVRFHWDRNQDQSMRCRLAQVWAGKQWGGIFIPRVGMEVVVEFLEGDPDSPLVIGCVYNGDNKPPYPLPGEKNTAGWKSNSTTGGGGYNEIAFIDTKGQEVLRVHAERDLTTAVGRDEQRTIGRNRSGTVGANDSLHVGAELYVWAKDKITFEVGKSSIVMDGMSVTITSPIVEVKAAMQFKSSSGMVSEHSAAALMDIKGTIVKINT
ncbi:type VI secretion system Vgr family protein [Propylenella binzhouense]|uniref:Type VI secretion system tip protein VgrG n=1 Tax=Propylenella binzhouense TaxID=2555902 RepID=A0A964T861_9HYPH|nr:type VI secretion system tip protein TssI/VgrG [Propylenella binzhouense]MYZ50333.1 type VI secretion system tip protein VgrG [Propylenella binzhouense]